MKYIRTKRYLMVLAIAMVSFTVTFTNSNVSVNGLTTTNKKMSKETIVKKSSFPQPIINGVATNYNKGDAISISIFSTDFVGKVQYKIVVNKIGTSSKLVYNLTNGYSAAVDASKIYGIKVPALFEEGKYSIIAYAKRNGAKVAYDKLYSKSFNIYKDVTIKKNNQIYELPLSSMNLRGNIYITANNTTIRNANIKGNIVIKDTANGKLFLKNIAVASIEIQTNKSISLSLQNVKANKITISNKTKAITNIKLIGTTEIKEVAVHSKATFEIGDASKILKLEDKNTLSNLIVDYSGNIVKTAQANGVDLTTSAAIDANQTNPTPSPLPTAPTPSPIAQVTPTTAPVEITPTPSPVVQTTPTPVPTAIPTPTVVVPPPVNLPSLPVIENGPVVEYIGLLTSTSSNPITFSGGANNYSMDLSSFADNIFVQRLCVTVSKSCILNIKGVSFNLNAHEQKQIKVLTDFGLTDNLPEGAGMVAARAMFGSSLNLSGTLNDGTNPIVNINIIIKLK